MGVDTPNPGMSFILGTAPTYQHNIKGQALVYPCGYLHIAHIPLQQQCMSRYVNEA